MTEPTPNPEFNIHKLRRWNNQEPPYHPGYVDDINALLDAVEAAHAEVASGYHTDYLVRLLEALERFDFTE